MLVFLQLFEFGISLAVSAGIFFYLFVSFHIRMTLDIPVLSAVSFSKGFPSLFQPQTCFFHVCPCFEVFFRSTAGDSVGGLQGAVLSVEMWVGHLLRLPVTWG